MQRSSSLGEGQTKMFQAEEIKSLYFEATIVDSIREAGSSHTRYVISVLIPGKDVKMWTVNRFYYEFKRLHEALAGLHFPAPSLPPRALWGRTNNLLVRRMESLNMYLQGILAIWKSLYSPTDDGFTHLSRLISHFLCSESIFSSNLLPQNDGFLNHFSASSSRLFYTPKKKPFLINGGGKPFFFTIY